MRAVLTLSGLLLAAVAVAVAPVWAGIAAAAETTAEPTTGSSDPLVTEINEVIRTAWTENEVTPSAVADDAEWLRRAYLDIVGQIPDSATVETFMADNDKAKRSKVIDQLVGDPRYVRNFTTVWANILIGRNAPDRTRYSASHLV